jgi:dUTP pyrophosphatase
VGTGVFDEDYRGNVVRGDEIAQLIYEKIYYPELESKEELNDSWREGRGFGSTGRT